MLNRLNGKSLKRSGQIQIAFVCCLLVACGCRQDSPVVEPKPGGPESTKSEQTQPAAGYEESVALVDLTGFLVPTDEEPTIEEPAKVLEALWQGMANDPQTKAILKRTNGGLDVNFEFLELPQDFMTSGDGESRDKKTYLLEKIGREPTVSTSSDGALIRELADDSVVFRFCYYQPEPVTEADLPATRYLDAYRYSFRVGNVQMPTGKEMVELAGKNRLGGFSIAANEYLLRNIKGWILDPGDKGFWNSEIKQPVNAEKARIDVADSIKTQEEVARKCLEEVRQLLTPDAKE